MTAEEFNPDDYQDQPVTDGEDLARPLDKEAELETGADALVSTVEAQAKLLVRQIFGDNPHTRSTFDGDAFAAEAFTEYSELRARLAAKIADLVVDHFPLIVSDQEELNRYARNAQDAHRLGNVETIADLFTNDQDESVDENELAASSNDGIEYTNLADIPEHDENHAADLAAGMVEQMYGEPQSGGHTAEEKAAITAYNGLLEDAQADISSSLLGWYQEITAAAQRVRETQSETIRNDFQQVLKQAGLSDEFGLGQAADGDAS